MTALCVTRVWEFVIKKRKSLYAVMLVGLFWYCEKSRWNIIYWLYEDTKEIKWYKVLIYIFNNTPLVSEHSTDKTDLVRNGN